MASGAESPAASSRAGAKRGSKKAAPTTAKRTNKATRRASHPESGSASTEPPLVEPHPYQPALPEQAKALVVGSFPPVRRSMEYFYPNAANDMWRVLGSVFYGYPGYFFATPTEDAEAKPRRTSRVCFNEARVRRFAEEKQVGFCDVAKSVRRHQGNASDSNLEIVERRDIATEVLPHVPFCEALVATGKLTFEVLCDQARAPTTSLTNASSLATRSTKRVPSTGGSLEWTVPTVGGSRTVRVFCAPSTSRAYAIPLEAKAAAYRAIFAQYYNLPPPPPSL